MRPAGNLCDLLIEQVGGHEPRSHPLVGRPISQLAVAVVAPGEQLPV